MNTEELILKKLDAIIGLLAAQGKDDDDKVKVLKSLDFTYREISNLTGIPEGTLKSRDSRDPKKGNSSK